MWHLSSAPLRMGSPHIAASDRAPAALKCMEVVWRLRMLRSAYAMVGASRMQRGSGKQELAVLRVQFHSRRFDSTTASVCRTPPAHSLAEARSVTISTEAELRASIHNHPLDTKQECRFNAARAFP